MRWAAWWKEEIDANSPIAGLLHTETYSVFHSNNIQNTSSQEKKKAKTYSDECAASDTVEQRVVSAENVSGLCGQGKDTAEVPTATVGLGMLRTCSSVHTGTLEPIAAPWAVLV